MESNVLKYVDINPDAKPEAIIIWLHGLGVDGHDFVPIVPELRIPETLPIRYVFPHAPRRSVTINAGMVMPAWFDILDLEGMHRVNEDHIRESADFLKTLLEYELLSGIPSERVVLAGFSQGGSIALYTGLRFEKKLAGILALSTTLHAADNLEKEASEANRDIPIMMAHGSHDPLIPIENAQTSRDNLIRLGYKVSWHAYPVEHTVCMDEIKDIREWLINLLLDGKPNEDL
jgi:phospholipase/carboxylesterase